MAKITKGEETRNQIIDACRELFFENGYNNTSARMISKRAGTNLGLLNYHFDGKIELGKLIYLEIRNEYNELISNYEPDFTDLEQFFFSSAVELSLCLSNPNFGLFYYEIIQKEPVHERLVDFVQSKIETYGSFSDPLYPALSAVSAAAVKPAIVRHVLKNPDQAPPETYLKYYLEQQLHYFKLDTNSADYYLNRLKSYHIDIAPKFTPIFIRLK